jgi:hypothetical protein
MSIGVRFRGGHIAWELGGIRPLEWDSDEDILLFPLLKATIVF